MPRTKKPTPPAEPEPPVPVELAATPGARLRQAREAAGRSLADVSRVTCIVERYLAALEDGDYAAFRGTVYILGFARAYAREVEADEDWVVARVREDTAHLKPDLLLTHHLESGRRLFRRRALARA